MKAIPKDKQIAEYTLISAPIDETNVQSDIIRRVFDNEECITRKGTYLGYVEDMAVKATIFYNNVFLHSSIRMRQTKAYSPALSYLVSQKTSTRIYIYWKLFPVYL